MNNVCVEDGVELSCKWAEDNLIISFKVPDYEEDNNIVTFHFRNKNIFEQCRELFKEEHVFTINDKEHNIVLEVGCTSMDESLVYFELLDYNSDLKKDGATIYQIELHPEDLSYGSMKTLLKLIEKEKEVGFIDEYKFDYAQYKR